MLGAGRGPGRDTWGMRLRPLSAWMLLTAACSSVAPDVEPPRPDGGAEPPAPPPPALAEVPDAGPAPALPLAWLPCPLKSEGGGPEAECTTAQVPLRAEDPGGETLEVRVKRFHPPGGKSLRQLWMLQGGPGGSAYVFEGIAEAIATRYPDVDFYLPDHRGTGASSRITCGAERTSSPGGFFITEGEWPACVAEVKASLGDRLGAYTTTNAANDLGVLVERARVPGQGVFVYGVSYGTYLANRYLQLYPAQADGVVLDSLAPPGASLARQDQDGNEAAKDFFDACGRDAFCAEKLGPDPWARAEALFAKLKAGHCAAIGTPGIPTYVALRRAFGGFLMSPDYRPFVPAVVYRADRCAPNDVAALKTFVGLVAGEPGGPGEPDEMMRQWGWILSNNIALSEMWEEPSPTAADLEAIREGAVASRDVTIGLGLHIGSWPTYPKDRYMGLWPSTSTPVLVLHGGLDPATLVRKARPAKQVFTRPGQHYVEVPTATHTVIASSTTTAKRSCGTQIMMSFFESPAAPDTSCLADVLPLDFRGNAAIANAFFGTPDAWE